VLALLLLLAETVFEIRGSLAPETYAVVYLHAVDSPFSTSTTSDARGRFRFSRIPAGTYTISVFTPGRSETHRTVSIGPSSADENGRIEVSVQIDESPRDVQRRHTVSAKELSIPSKAQREYQEGEKLLAKNNVPGAIARLEQAILIAPQYSMAWNRLGTIAYKTQRYADAEKYFRRALDEDPTAYAPLVNLGGVLLNLAKFEEALKYNLYAATERPNDALANAQLGITYAGLGQVDAAEKYLRESLKLDPAHFSNPQLILADIAIRRGEPGQAADWLEDFLQYHPDWPDAERMRAKIALWRSAPPR
jgi:tetratricopeptide (TPR) repeat protein